MIQLKEGLTFDDVMMIPEYSDIETRSKVDISVKWGNLEYKHPIIPSNMKTITGLEMAFKVASSGGLPILHRFMPLEEQLSNAEDLLDNYGPKHCVVSVGVKNEDKAAVSRFYKLGVKMICIDIAHGDSKVCVDMITWIKQQYPELFIIAGNVATGSGAERLWRAGANVVKSGVGGGSLCTTRIETGNGVPQLTTLMEVVAAQKRLLELYKTKDIGTNTKRQFPFISDGGAKSAGDFVKALAFADMVMTGNMFAGCDETPGHIINIDGKPYKEYVGSSTHKTNHIEGVAALASYKGSFDNVLTKLLEGIKSGCSYQGAHNLSELKENPRFIRITGSGLRESHPHDVMVR